MSNNAARLIPAGIVASRVVNNRSSTSMLPINLVKSGKYVEEFLNPSDWTKVGSGSIAANSTQKWKNRNSIKFLTATNESLSGTKVINFKFSGKTIRLAIYKGNSNLSLAAIRFSSTTDFSKYFEKTYSAANITSSRWNYFSLKREDFTCVGNESWDNTMIRLQILVTPTASQLTSVSLGEIIDVESAQPVCILSMDDGLPTQMTTIFSYMRERNIMATLYLVTNWVTDWSKYEEMYRFGWDLGNHTHNHVDLTTLNQADLTTELQTARDILNTHQMNRASCHLAYPFGSGNANVYSWAATAGMISGRRITPASQNPSLPYMDWFQFGARALNFSNRWDGLKSFLDDAIRKEEIFSVYWHEAQGNPDSIYHCYLNDFMQMIDYITDLHIPCLTISQLYSLQNSYCQVSIP